DGYLVTCAHVVDDAATLQVAIDGKTYQAGVVSVDETQDLAILKIEAQNMPALPLGNSDGVEVGEDVRAVGYPLSSVLGDSLKATKGSVSGIQMDKGQKTFQIDARVNPGNS